MLYSILKKTKGSRWYQVYSTHTAEDTASINAQLLEQKHPLNKYVVVEHEHPVHLITDPNGFVTFKGGYKARV